MTTLALATVYAKHVDGSLRWACTKSKLPGRIYVLCVYTGCQHAMSTRGWLARLMYETLPRFVYPTLALHQPCHDGQTLNKYSTGPTRPGTCQPSMRQACHWCHSRQPLATSPLATAPNKHCSKRERVRGCRVLQERSVRVNRRSTPRQRCPQAQHYRMLYARKSSQVSTSAISTAAQAESALRAAAASRGCPQPR
jgi:hypothetical protein